VRALRSPLSPGGRRRPRSAPEVPGVTPQFTELPAWPFSVAVSPGGERAFVSMPRAGHRGLVSLQAGPPWRVEGVVWLGDELIPRGIAVERTGRHVLIANGAGGLLVADAHALRAGTDEPFHAIVSAPARGSVQIALEPAGRFAFVTDEDSATLSVFDFGGSLGSESPDAALVGQTALPPGPVGAVCSADGQHLFVTSQRDRRGRQPGVLSVLVVADLVEAPERVAVVSLPAGHTPVRVAVSASDPELVWVTARGSNSLLAFDRERLVAGRARALRAVVGVGIAPTGLAVLAGGSRVVVANSNRYGGADQPQTLAVVDVQAALRHRSSALLGTIPAGAWPREVVALPDDRTVLVTNVYSKSLESVVIA
jgi:DNA-binding beta-propeller fold protein YncE